MTTYEGGVRVPSMIRWPDYFPAGTILNGIQQHQDMFTTLAAAAGIEDVNAEVMEEKQQYIDGGQPRLLEGRVRSFRPHQPLLLLREQADGGADGAVEIPLLHQGGLLRLDRGAHGAVGLQHPHGPVREL